MSRGSFEIYGGNVLKYMVIYCVIMLLFNLVNDSMHNGAGDQEH